MLALVVVESGEADGGEGRHHEDDERQETHPPFPDGGRQRTQQLRQEDEHNGGGRHAEGDHVGKRVHVHAHGRLHMQHPRSETVEKVENGRQKNHHGGDLQQAAGGEQNGKATGDQVATGDKVGDVFFHLEIGLQKYIFFHNLMCKKNEQKNNMSGQIVLYLYP